jgi:hypothetical protein
VYVQGPREQVRSCSSKKAVVLHQFRDDSWEDLWLKTQTRLSWGEGGGWSQQQKVDQGAAAERMPEGWGFVRLWARSRSICVWSRIQGF